MEALAHLVGASGAAHDLIDHLRDVARRARELATLLRAERAPLADLAEWAGLLHDLGKLRIEFQEYLRGKRPRGMDTQHAVFGAALAVLLRLPMAIAFAINGHHAGLHDRNALIEKIQSAELTPLQEAERLLRILERDSRAVGHAFPERMSEIFRRRPDAPGTVATHEELLVRMLFSCLVDADFLDTERHYAGHERDPGVLDPKVLLTKVDRHVRGLEELEGDRSLLETRRAIYEKCLAAADGPTGLFTLTTPTGGGKTLAGMAFALRHAERNGLRRVIAVIPFLSIIEQNARIYRRILGDDVVIEHHSGVAVDHPAGEGDEPPVRTSAELAAENWDAPVIVTTSVQFLESLFARLPRCRKLHNLARSVVILDEVQTLPHHLLEPTVDVIRELARSYGMSFVFCSATQPGFARSEGLPSGFERNEVIEIAPEPARVFATLNRVRYELPAVTEAPWDWDTLADRLVGYGQVLTIVNLRRHAVELFNKLTAKVPPNLRKAIFHLSSAMCAEHRFKILGDKDQPEPGTIYHALKKKRPCWVISTQVVEAGVDIDFPVVYRAMAPLDAIIQSAGRCNREGKLNAPDGSPGGLVVVFQSADPQATPPGLYRFQTNKTGDSLRRVVPDPRQLATDPELYAEYHRQVLIWNPSDVSRRLPGGQMDTTIQEDRKALNFEKVAAKAKVIEDSGQAIVVPYEGAIPILEKLRGKPRLFRDDLRRLQRYLVNLREADIKDLGGLLTPIADVEGPHELDPSAYDDKLGVKVGERPPEDFVFGLV